MAAPEAVEEPEADVGVEEDTGIEPDADVPEDAGDEELEVQEPGTLIVGGASMFEIAARADGAEVAADMVGVPAFGIELEVVAVPSDEALLVQAPDAGDPEAGPILVELVGAGESPVDVQPGDLVSFQGTLESTPDSFVEPLGLTPEQAEVVQNLGYNIRVEPADLEIVE